MLALVFVHRSYYPWAPEQWVVLTLVAKDIVDQALLASICGENRYLVCGVPKQSHVHVQSDRILGFAQVDHPVRCGLFFSFTLVVLHIDELVLVLEAWVRDLELRIGDDRRQIRERRITPFVELSDGCTGTTLLVEHDGWYAQADKPLEKRLFQVGVLTKCKILNDGRVLEMITTEDYTLQWKFTILWVLQCEWDEVLNLSDLSSFFHDDIVIVEP